MNKIKFLLISFSLILLYSINIDFTPTTSYAQIFEFDEEDYYESEEEEKNIPTTTKNSKDESATKTNSKDIDNGPSSSSSSSSVNSEDTDKETCLEVKLNKQQFYLQIMMMIRILIPIFQISTL